MTLFLCLESSDLKINQAQQPFAEIDQADGLPNPAGPHSTCLFSGNTFGLIFMGFVFTFTFPYLWVVYIHMYYFQDNWEVVLFRNQELNIGGW